LLKSEILLSTAKLADYGAKVIVYYGSFVFIAMFVPDAKTLQLAVAALVKVLSKDKSKIASLNIQF